MKYNLREILQATNGKCSAHSGEINGVVIDSRKVVAGNLYVAFKGEHVDGHDFVGSALEAGANFALVERLNPDAPADAQIIVPDCLLALQQLAAYQRNRSNFKIVGVTGSVGKTSTKEMLSLVLGAQVQVHATSGNYNNHIGMPLTLVNAPAEAQVVVLEMGMNHAGEISVLSNIAKPDIAIITTVDAVHLEFFESVAGIAHAKAEIMDGMRQRAEIILPLDNPYFQILANKANAQGLHIIEFGKNTDADFRLLQTNTNEGGTNAEISIKEVQHQLTLNVAGEHLAINALAVLACVEALNLNIAKAIQDLRHFKDAKGRGDIHLINLRNNVNVQIIDETYNASPASMRSSLNKLQALAGQKRKIAVLGDMKELGDNAPQFHAELAQELVACQIDALFCVGAMMQYLFAAAQPLMANCFHFANNAELAQSLNAHLQDGDMVLCKGSRSSHIEEIINLLKNK
jgi:UDP-N-acetylmuramoyl-tripeptide--D-alanyl-D-alanine ligase